MSESIKITRDMIFNVQYDKTITKTETPHAGGLQTKWIKPCALIVFDGGDLNNSALLVAKAAQTPFAANSIASVLVQESIRDAFISKVRANLKPLEPSVAANEIFKRTLESIAQNQTVTVTAAEYLEKSPLLVCDVSQNYLCPSGPSGAITLNTFRTAKEALTLLSKDALAYEAVSIWNENLSASYELATKLKSKIYYFNCHAITLEPVRTQFDSGSDNFVTIAQNHHYELLTLGGTQKVIIVFPIGTIFAN